MNGHNTPVRALTQMMKLQKATDSGTPSNPLRDSVGETEEFRQSAGGETTNWESFAAGAGEIRHFNSTSAGISGAGVGAEFALPAHGQDSSPSQQPAGWPWVVHGTVPFAAKQDGTWESWITSPMSNPMIDLRFISSVRVRTTSDYSKSFSCGPTASIPTGRAMCPD